MEERKIVGYWDCSSCNTKGILGTEETCPHCGAPKGNTKCYMDANRKIYLDNETAKEYGKGANWICPYCENQNRYNATHCRGCGAPKTDSTKDYFGNDPNKTNSQKERSEEHSASYYERSKVLARESAEQEKSDYPKRPSDIDYVETRKHTKNFNTKFSKFFSAYKVHLLAGVAALAGIIALIAIIVAIFTPHNYSATVTANNWERAISIQEYKTVKESDWFVPIGGRVYRTAEEIHHYDTILDHYDTVTEQKSRQVIDHYDTHVEYSYSDNGDGTFSEHSHTVSDPVYRTEYYTETKQEPVYVTVPVYDTKFYYEIERWVHNRTEKASGKNDEQPYYPKYQLDEKERVSEKSEHYTVLFTTEDKKEYWKKVSAEEWNSLHIGTKVNITIQAGMVTKFEILATSK